MIRKNFIKSMQRCTDDSVRAPYFCAIDDSMGDDTMEKLYSIGQTAKIMGISVQTLRNYSNSALLSPAYINEETGYRYFTFSQFHVIDRIKYLRGFGLSLAEIEEIITAGKVDKTVHFLELQRKKIDREIEELQMKKEDIGWYINYFTYLTDSSHNALPHMSHFPERYVLYTKCPRDYTIEDIEVHLAEMKTAYIERGYRFHRQYGYLLDYDSIIGRDWRPTHYFIYVSELPPDGTQDDQIFSFPEADYLCFSFRLRHMEELNVNLIREYFKDRDLPPYVIANEHEDNLKTYKYCPYELQFMLV